jgi:hypothetical protein
MGRKKFSTESKKGKLSITISKENFNLLENENKSKIINDILEDYFKKEKGYKNDFR